VEGLLPLVRGYREFYQQTHDAQRERDFMQANLREGRSVVFLAIVDDVAVGFVQIFPSHSTVWLAPSLILEDLFVLPAARGSGVASALLDAACDYARSIGAAGMFLETAMDNLTAQRVYERNGWTREGRFFKYNAPG
jgi:GNAT superfamily N-acetyltransferase